MRISNLIVSTTLLFISNLLVRLLGFLYKIFLSHNIGESGLGIYHILFNFLMICLGLTTTGIPTTLSHIISKKNALKDKKGRNTIFISTIYISIFIAFGLSLFLSINSSYVSSIVLKDSSLELLILAISPAVIVITMSNTLRSYYYGMKNVIVPAIGQLLEQISRMLFVYLLISLLNNDELNCYIALLGISIGEIINIFFIVLCLYKSPNFDNKYSISIEDFRNSSLYVLKNSIPITCNRMFSTLIHSMTSIIIPSRLIFTGMSYQQSLSIYGVISGMVMPLVYLPFTLGSALVVNLIPSISQEVALNNHRRIRLKIKFALTLSFIVGLCTSLIFYFYSDEVCTYLFHNSLAGIYLEYMFLIPLFITLNQTLTAILHTLGKEVISSIVTIITLSIQLFFTYFLVPIPELNIFGYIYAFTATSILTFACLSYILYKELR